MKEKKLGVVEWRNNKPIFFFEKTLNFYKFITII